MDKRRPSFFNAAMNDALPTRLYTAAQVRELDRRAIEEQGIEAYTLMQRAGVAALAVLNARWPTVERVQLLCGAGNNGGDALVLARLLREAGKQEQLFMLAGNKALEGAAQQALQAYEAAGGVVQRMAHHHEALVGAELIVDGLLGTGLSRPVEGEMAALIAAVSDLARQGTPVLALDIPSGLHADTGAELGSAVHASVTVSFIGLKLGLLTAAGPGCCGELLFDDLAVPEAVYEGLQPAAQRLDDGWRQHYLPARAPLAHKGQHGRVACVGGDEGMGGAIRLAAEAALRAGAGLVSVATQPAAAQAMSQARPELMARGVSDRSVCREVVAAADAVLIGPGLGQSAWGESLWHEVMQATSAPMVVDADALNLLAANPLRRDDWVLTPHPGEAARLLDRSTAQVQADRVAAVNDLLDLYGGTVVLKGPGTLVKRQGGSLWVCAQGNPGMAVGGMGDVLGGLIAGFLAQGLAVEAAAGLGVYIHARAADLAAAELGQRGLLPSDLWPYLRDLVNP